MRCRCGRSCGRALARRSGRLCLRLGLSLVLGLAGVLLLLEVLKAKKDNNGEQHERHEAAKIAAAVAAATAAGALRFQIGVFKLGQRLLPVVLRSALVYGNGLCGKGAGGTGSRPPRLKGWQRSRRQVASTTPRNGPWFAIATAAYSEQVGTKRHPPGLSVWRAGEIQRR